VIDHTPPELYRQRAKRAEFIQNYGQKKAVSEDTAYYKFILKTYFASVAVAAGASGAVCAAGAACGA
jgi:hypothetical protein